MMTPTTWQFVKHFRPFGPDNWGDPERMDAGLVMALDKLREHLGRPVHVHSGFRTDNRASQHALGKAVDIHVEGLHVIDQFLEASRFLEFTGIGVYSYWNNPGLHLDVRLLPVGGFRSLWGRNESGEYVPLTANFLKGV